jgi:hypothetical protein
MSREAMRTSDGTGSPFRSVSVTPHDTDFIEMFQELHIGATGNLAVTMADGNEQVFANVPAGRFIAQGNRIKATGTTATGIVALYSA